MTHAAQHLLEAFVQIKPGGNPSVMVFTTAAGNQFLMGIVDPNDGLHSTNLVHLLHPAICIRSEDQIVLVQLEGVGDDFFVTPEGYLGWGFAAEPYLAHYNQWLSEKVGHPAPPTAAGPQPESVATPLVPLPEPQEEMVGTDSDIVESLMDKGLPLATAFDLVTKVHEEEIAAAFAHGTSVEDIASALFHLATHP